MSKRARSDDGEEDEEELEMLEEEMPTGIDPYSVLSLSRSASQDDVKRAYRKAALKHHPDKAPEDQKAAAHTKFQEVAFAFAILSDERRRKRYDTSGSTDESLDIDDDDFNWTDFFREQYETLVSEERINEFSSGYKGSDEERAAVLQYYEKHKGSMSKLFQEVMLSDMVDDEDRFREIIDAAIAAEEVKAWPKYTQESESARRKRIANAKRLKVGEAAEAEELKEELEKNKKAKKGGKKAEANGGMDDLAALIQSRQKQRSGGGFLDRLEEKYGKKGGRDEPSEEAFARNAKKPDADEGARKSKRARK